MSWMRRPRRPRSFPSDDAASSSSITEPWAWAVVAPSSLRVAVHVTGFLSRQAATAVSTSSANTLPLAPNPPPTSSANTRTLSSGRSRAEATAPRTPKTFWVEVHSFIPPVSESGVAVTDLGSIAAPATRSVVSVMLATTESDPNAPLMSP